MFNKATKLCLTFTVFSAMLLTNKNQVFAETFAKTTENVSFREEPSQKADIIKLVIANNEVEIIEEVDNEWSKVIVGENTGFIKSDYLEAFEKYKSFNGSQVELTPWTEAKQIFTTGVDAAVYDVYTGKVYNVRSFSNGRHADVEPSTTEDTRILKETYGGRWSWDPRPVWVNINGRTMAASINGMPHGGGVISGNGLNGQICIHFLGSSTHNGNGSFTRLHQDVLHTAYNLAK